MSDINVIVEDPDIANVAITIEDPVIEVVDVVVTALDSIPGPTGPAGPIGPVGPIGPTGPTGPAGVAPPDPNTYIVKDTIFSTISTTGADTGLKFRPDANAVYEYEFMGFARTNATTSNGVNVGIIYPTSGMVRAISFHDQPLDTPEYYFVTTSFLTDATSSPSLTEFPISLSGVFVTSTTPPSDFIIVLATESSARQVHLEPGSFLKYRRIG